MTTTPDDSNAKAALQDQLRVLLARVKRIDAELSVEPDDDVEERAMEMANTDVLDQLGKSTRAEIKKIQDAIEQMNTGKYGICKRCGNAIPEGRLEALPFAVTCTKCA